MASKPGLLTDWPWTLLGNFKYLVLAPGTIHCIYSYVTSTVEEADLTPFIILPFLLLRILHNQLWISLSRYRTANGRCLIVDKSIDFDQVDRERNWDDQIIFNGLLLYLGHWGLEGGKRLPVWRTDGVILTALLHVGPVEFLYYWLHRALHHHFLYSRYHSHHHSSIVTEPITLSHVHSIFRTNYSLFMPFYDYVYGTMDQSTDRLYDSSLKKPQHSSDVVYLTHLTTPHSIYQSRLGFASLASNPLSPKWYLWLMWPVTLWSMILTWIYGRTFVVEANTFDKLRLQSWSIPRYTIHYSLKRQRVAIRKLVEEAVLDADDKNVKVKLVDGSSLAVAVILNRIPKEATNILFRAKLSKIGYFIVSTLCQKGMQVATLRQDEYEKLKISIPLEYRKNLVLSNGSTYKTWLVGQDLTKDEQSMASKGTMFTPIDQFPPKKARKDCFYLHTPSMLVPSSLGNLHACENWLPRRAMSAWRIAGIVHAMEGWKVNECGDTIFNVDQVWKAAISHGFRLNSPSPN
ncbi:hypothetical protein V2J09_024127 [Rumex salicifolius]